MNKPAPSFAVLTEQASKTYQADDTSVRALDGVDLQIERGAFMALVGPSGSGKTTLLNLVGALDMPSAGRLWVDGKEIGAMSATRRAEIRLRKIGFVFQEYNLIPVLSALENVEYVMMLQGVAPEERTRRSRAMLAALGLEGLEHRRPRQLSGGQQQRVAVARAVVAQPVLVLADEPTANLDSASGGSLMDLMRALNERHGVTFVFSTHDPMVMERARRIVRMRDGRIVADERRPA